MMFFFVDIDIHVVGLSLKILAPPGQKEHMPLT